MVDSTAKPLSEKPLGYLLAAAGGVLGGPIGIIASLVIIFALSKVMTAKDGKTPNRFLAWAAVGIIGAPLSLLPFQPTPEQLAQQQQERQAEAAKAKEVEKQAKRAEEVIKEIKKVDNWYANESKYSCEINLEEKLREPGSYRRDGDFVTTNDNGVNKVIAWKFRAKNGFGGFNVATALCSVSKENGGTIRTETISQ